MFEDNIQVEEAFSAASQELIRGRSWEAVIANYPEHATELEPLLRVTHALRSLSHPLFTQEAMQRIIRRVQAAADEKNAERHAAPALTLVQPGEHSRYAAGAGSPSRWPRTWLPSRRAGAILVVVAAVILLVGLFAVLSWYKSSDSRDLETYSGKIIRLTDNGWIVGGTEIYVDKNTLIHGNPVVGAEVTCVTEPFPPGDRVRAIEVWVRSEPSTTPANKPSGSGVSPP